MKKKPFKILLNIFIIIISLGLVLFFSLKDNYQEILNTISKMNPIYLIGAILILCIYRFISSIAYYNIVKINKEEISLLKCFQINFMILFFNGVTPFSGGGQPMEVYYLHKEGISITKATNITLQNFIVYQIALVTVGTIALAYNNIYNLFPNDNFIKKLVLLGFTINLLVLVASFILSFGKKLQMFISEKGIRFLAKLNIIKDENKIQTKLSEYLHNFHNNAVRLRKNKKRVLGLIMINIIGLFIMYSMPYMIAKGMNINISLIDTIIATAYVMIIGSFIPIPGGTGGIEYGFVFFYNYLIKGSLANAIMLIWRFISYYLGMIFGSIALSLYRKKEKQCE